MRHLLILYGLLISHALYSQVAYTYIDKDPVLEQEKKNKEKYFESLRAAASKSLEECLRKAGCYEKGHAHPADGKTACERMISKHDVDLCNCAKLNEGTLTTIKQQEDDWNRVALKRQKEYDAKKIREQEIKLASEYQVQQEQSIQNPQLSTAEANLNVAQKQFAEQQQRFQQTQIELENAKNVSMSAYQQAINSGKKESGALLDATLAGAEQIGDAKSQLIYTGVGLGVSLLTHLSEIKSEKNAQIMAIQEDNLRTKLIIETKSLFIKDFQKVSNYTLKDLSNKNRYAVLLIFPRQFTEDSQNIYFTLPTLITPYSDNAYPSKKEIETQLLGCIDSDIKSNKSFMALFPIINVEEFEKDFIKKIGSGNVINLNAQLINCTKLLHNSTQQNETDFWGNPIEKQPSDRKKNSFWD